MGDAMADITLAEFNERVWLVGGEELLDDMLANTLAPDVSIEVVACGAMEDVTALWVQHCGPPTRTGDPWLIHPAIAKRVRRISADHAVFFAQWSAMLDQDALTVIRSAAALARTEDRFPVVLTEYLDEGAPKSLSDLTSLRALLVEEKLVEEGISAVRITRARRALADVPGNGGDSQRLDIVIREAGAA